LPPDCWADNTPAEKNNSKAKTNMTFPRG